MNIKYKNVKPSHNKGNNLVQPIHIVIKPVVLESTLHELMDHCDTSVSRKK